MERFAKIVNARKWFTIFANAPPWMFDRVLNTPQQYTSNQFLEHVKSPYMPYLKITFL